MCGIAGIIGAEAQEAKLDAMLRAQHHRGPDACEKAIFTSAVLGHNRLSIIDLSSDANQPFCSQDNRYVLVFNGEIYNYLELKLELETNYDFKTVSDTEVLLAAYLKWGKRCLDMLNGMFSFAIWDTEKEVLFAARDRFGVKPFYYTQNENQLYFASEIKALHAAGIPKKMNEEVWANYFCYGSYGMPNETFYEGISQLPGGHTLSLENNEMTITRWYEFEVAIKNQSVLTSEVAVIKAYTALLEDSIKLRFRADVPVGINVSGGLDSSALLTFVKLTQDASQCNAYSFYTGDARYDELPWVEKMLNFADCPLQKVKYTAADVRQDSRKMALQQDEPYGGVPTLAYGALFKKARKDGVIVLLDGQGMDEQWAGYDYYKSLISEEKKEVTTIQGVHASPFRKNVLSKEFLTLASKPVYPTPFKSAVQNTQYRDLFYTKIPRALRFNDRVSMAASTELREPFLDYRLVEFAFAQKQEFKVKGDTQKYILRKIVDTYLSQDISFAPKRPLQTPQREWLAQDLKPMVKNIVNSLQNSSAKNWFDIPILEAEMECYFEGDQDSSFHIWQWINLGVLLDVEND